MNYSLNFQIQFSETISILYLFYLKTFFKNSSSLGKQLKNCHIIYFHHFSLFLIYYSLIRILYMFFWIYIYTYSVQSLSRVRLFATPWIAAQQASLSITNSQSSPKPMSIESDAIQLSHPLSSPSPPALNLSQHQGLFQWVNSFHEVAKVLEFQLQYQSFQWTPRTDLL